MKLTRDRIAQLDALGFDWTQKRSNPKSVTKKTFADRIHDLQAYKHEHGHLNVKRTDDKSLADFCANIRQSVKNQGKGGMRVNVSTSRVACA